MGALGANFVRSPCIFIGSNLLHAIARSSCGVRYFLFLLLSALSLLILLCLRCFNVLHNINCSFCEMAKIALPSARLIVQTKRDLFAPREYTFIKNLGTGSFGSVFVADWYSSLPSGALVPAMQHSYTRPEYLGRRIVAIKRMKRKFQTWDDCMLLNELKALFSIPPHDHIIPLYDLFILPTTQQLHLVFECMEGNLYQLIKARRGHPLVAGLIASILTQALEGLAHIHACGFFHRDIKPENMLITTLGLGQYPIANDNFAEDVLVIVKIADFGLAREIQSYPPFTEYVSTRWYRAPEILLHARDYTPAVDIWALGAIAYELVTLQPLFPGVDGVDQLARIAKVLGSSLADTGELRGGGAWPHGLALMHESGLYLPFHEPPLFSTLFAPNTSKWLIEMIFSMLRYDPSKRPTSKDCLIHPFVMIEGPKCQPVKSILPQPLSPALFPPSVIYTPKSRTWPLHVRTSNVGVNREYTPSLSEQLATSLQLGETSSPNLSTLSTVSSPKKPQAPCDTTDSVCLPDEQPETTISKLNMQRTTSQTVRFRKKAPPMQKSSSESCSAAMSSPISGVSINSPSNFSLYSGQEHISDQHASLDPEPASYSIFGIRSLRRDVAQRDKLASKRTADRERREHEANIMRERSRAVLQRRSAIQKSGYSNPANLCYDLGI